MLSGISILCFAASYAIAFALELVGLKARFAWRRAAVVAMTIAGLAAHTLYLSHVASERALSTSTAEWFLMAGWVLAVIYLAALFYLPRAPIGLMLLPIVLGLILGSTFADPRPLGPERSFYLWGMVHGLTLMLGTVAVCLGFIAGLMYLLQSYALKHVRSPANRLRLPSLEWLERVNSRTLGLSAVLIGLGFISGMVMSVALHRGETAYVLWRDPVVVSLAAMLAWLLAAELFRLVYPAARRGRKVAYLTLASFVFLVIALTSLTLLDSAHSVAPRRMSNGAEPLHGLRSAERETWIDFRRRSVIRTPQSRA